MRFASVNSMMMDRMCMGSMCMMAHTQNQNPTDFISH